MNKTLFYLIFTCILTDIARVEAQKISIYFDTPPTTTPSVSKAILKYNKDFAYSLTFDDASSDAFTTALPVMKGGKVMGNGVIYKGLFYTDGCGNDIPFRGGIAWNTANLQGIDTHTGNVSNQLTWKQLDTLYNEGWDVMNHSYSHKNRWILPMSDAEYLDEVQQNAVAVRNNTRKNIQMSVFIPPAGDNYYYTSALQTGHKIILDQSNATIGFGGFRIDTILNLYALKIHRIDLNNVYTRTVPSFIDTVAMKSKNGVKIWYNEFVHRIDDFTFNTPNYNFYYFKSYLESIANQYAKTGQDRIWMAPAQEVYEYMVARQTLNINTQLVNNRLDISYDLSAVPIDLRRKVITLVIPNTPNITRIDVPRGVIMSFKATGTSKIVNLDFSPIALSENNITQAPSVIDLFPNPTHDILNVKINNQNNQTIKITIADILGRILIEKNVQTTNFQINTTNLTLGTYFLAIQQGENHYQRTFIKTQ